MKKRAFKLILAVGVALLVHRLWPSQPGHPSEPGRHVSKGSVNLTRSRTIAGLFARFDTNHDAVLSEAELAKVLVEGRDAPLDDDGDGNIDQAEFALSYLYVNGAGTADEGVFIRQDLHHIEGLLSTDRVPQAVVESKRAVVKYPGASEAWSLHARVMEKAKSFPEAQRAYAQAIRIAPDDVDLKIAWVWFCITHLTPADGKESVEILLSTIDARLSRTGTKDPQSPEVQRAEGVLIQLINHYADNLNDPQQALTLIEWGLKRLPRDPRLLNFVLNAQVKKGDREKALATARELAKDPAATFAMTCFEARQLIATHRSKEAESLFREALKHEAGYEERTEALVQLYDLIAQLKRPDDAAVLLRQQLLPAAANLEQARNLARRLSVTTDAPQAIRQIRTAIASQVGNPEHWVLLAELCELRQDHAASREALQTALAQCGSKVDLALDIRKALADRFGGK